MKQRDPAVIRCTQHNALQYHLTKISDIEPKAGRVYVVKGDARGGAAWYAKYSKSCYRPTGAVPTPEVFKWIEENPRHVLAWDVDYDIIPPGQRDGHRRRLLPRAQSDHYGEEREEAKLPGSLCRA